MALRKAVFLQDHHAIYRADISKDIEKFQPTNYKLRAAIVEYSMREQPCVVEIPLCWSEIVFKYINRMISMDADILFQRIAAEYGGLKVKAKVTTNKFPQVKSTVREATLAIDNLVQERLKERYLEED